MSRMSALFFVLATSSATVHADNWPFWRGPTGQGICSETDLPVEWSPTKNVKWKVPLPERGNSTPVVWEGNVFLTQATDRTKERWTYCLDRENGKVIWKKGIKFTEPERTHKTSPYCSASPATDGERVIVSHGSAGVFCYGLNGKELWRRDLGKFDHVWGNAASPLIHGDLCFVNCGPGERTFLLALDKTSGKNVWKLDIAGGRGGGNSKTWTGSWSTPVIAREGDREVLYASYPGWLRALAPATGDELWRSAGLGNLVYTSPITTGKVVVAMSGFSGPPMAVRTGGSGDVTESHRLWHFDRGPQRIGSGVVREGHLYIVNDNGVAECLAVDTGQRVWRERLGTRSWTSLVLAGDKLYSADEGGNFFVLRASTKPEIIAKNQLGELTRASVAVSNGELFLRTYKHLWCIAEKG